MSWELYDEDGGEALTFDSLLSLDDSNEGQALSEPIEKGAFVSYNKVDSPRALRVELAIQGDADRQNAALADLDELREKAVKVALSTPAAYYDSLTLESFNYRRRSDAGAELLVVELSLVEVREVETQVSTTVMPPQSCKNPTSAGNQNTGKAGTEEVSGPKTSVLGNITGVGRDG
ncbi:MAG: hypothetical protein LBS31_08865 [Candidatus Adiutrix sp.]|jgi:hypothetical protein|nr:hypothetical protein [Candidatus Adiutrix sp.]